MFVTEVKKPFRKIVKSIKRIGFTKTHVKQLNLLRKMKQNNRAALRIVKELDNIINEIK